MSTQESVVVTVRCLTYNHMPFIRKSLEGFVMQKTNFRFEVVIHDDASTDGTADVVREFAEKYPEIIVPVLEKENLYSKGGGRISRVLEPYMRGKYVAYCEGDDYWTDPLKLQKQVDFLEAHPDYVLCYTDAEVVDENDAPVFHNTTRRYSGDVSKQLVKKGNFVIAASTCFRNLWSEWDQERTLLPFKLNMGDKPMWLFYSTKGKFKYFPKRMVAYRVLTESASHSRDFNKILAFKNNGEQIALFFNERYGIGVPERAIKKDYAKGRARAAAKVSRPVFIDYYKRMIRQYPETILNLRLWVVAFLRVVLNRSV